MPIGPAPPVFVTWRSPAMSSIETAVPKQGTSAAGRLRRGTVLTSGAVLTLGAAAIHLAGTPARLAESPLLGTGIAALGLAQLVLMVARSCC
jgi:hypothetical protein